MPKQENNPQSDQEFAKAVERVRNLKLGDSVGGGMIAAAVGKRGVAIYPGQSAEEVVMIANIIERELDDVCHYFACDVARKILLAQGKGCKE